MPRPRLLTHLGSLGLGMRLTYRRHITAHSFDDISNFRSEFSFLHFFHVAILPTPTNSTAYVTPVQSRIAILTDTCDRSTRLTCDVRLLVLGMLCNCQSVQVIDDGIWK